ncbi:prohead protease [Bacillus phage vB_BsuM-Goe2]|uniref:Prohead protease n=1 Tax=Bacillus phage vB_BsuM-Goe2 TaxID=1933062 RepID=A0A217EQJ9_9CAUD|nr:prohead protease [Bacillus phage vB_BsuM-Goe2]
MSNFRFFLGADILKSEDADERRIIRGYASTPAEDRQGESLVQKGLDISDFVTHGYFNFDHDNSKIVGYPFAEKCVVTEKGLWVEGELLKGVEEADRMWNLALALQKSNAPRKVGFSVEGKVLERDGNKILKAKIYNVAVTANPVNTTCSWDAVVKSFNAPTESLDKSLEAGYEVDPEKMEGGDVFRKESLDKDLKNLSYVMDDDKKKKILKEQLATKSLSKNELALYLQITKGWSMDDCEAFIKKNNLIGGTN